MYTHTHTHTQEPSLQPAGLAEYQKLIEEYVSGVISLHQDDLRPAPPLQWSFYMPTYGPPVPGDWGSVEIDVKEEVRKYRARQKFAWDTEDRKSVV